MGRTRTAWVLAILSLFLTPGVAAQQLDRLPTIALDDGLVGDEQEPIALPDGNFGDGLGIHGNDALRTLAGHLDWPGSGGPEDPYVFSGLQLRAASLMIDYVTLHLVVESCKIVEGNHTGYGIIVIQSYNITIRDCLVDGFQGGVAISGSNDVILANLTLRNHSWIGFDIYLSDVTISDSTVTDVFDGIRGFYSSIQLDRDVVNSTNMPFSLYLSFFCNITNSEFSTDNGYAAGILVAGFFCHFYNNTWDDLFYVSNSIISFGNNTLQNGGLYLADESALVSTLYHNNTVDGLPVRVIENESDIQLSESVGQWILRNISGVVVDGLESESQIGLAMFNADNVTLSNFTCSCGTGIVIYAEDLTVENSHFNGSWLTGAFRGQRHTIRNNTWVTNSSSGVWLDAQNTTFTGNSLIYEGEDEYGYQVGVNIGTGTSPSEISANTIRGYTRGIDMRRSENVTVEGNLIVGGRDGLFISGSNNTIRHNELWDAGLRFSPLNMGGPYFSNDVETTNLVNGYPPLFITNQTEVEVEGHRGPVFVINSDRVRLAGLDIVGGGTGVTVYASDEVTIHGGHFSGSSRGIEVSDSSRIHIMDNTFRDCGTAVHVSVYPQNYEWSSVESNDISRCQTGISAPNEEYIRIAGNWIQDSGTAIQAYSIGQSLITSNWIENNEVGIDVGYGSRPGTVFGNAFVNNTEIRAYEWSSGVFSSYPAGGNWWDNYSGVDLQSGEFQNEPRSDGFGDTPHPLNDQGIEDTFPLVFEDSPERVETLRARSGNSNVHLTWTSPANRPLYYEIHRTAGVSELMLRASAQEPSFTDVTVSNLGQYTYRVRGVNPDGPGPWSAVVEARPIAEPPSVPLRLDKFGVGKSLTLAWDRPETNGGSDLVGYRVYRSIAEEGPFQIIGETAGFQFTDEDPYENTHYYTVTAVNQLWEGPATEPLRHDFTGISRATLYSAILITLVSLPLLIGLLFVIRKGLLKMRKTPEELEDIMAPMEGEPEIKLFS